mgnify:CR=1 FL=1
MEAHNNMLCVLKNGYNEGGKDNPKKKPVLIIEDLDRLDPAHLFRILNVISAHIDECSKPDKVGNKFGFSNIVIVMDYDTTQHIFEHFYGKEASYAGYMSKFLSEEPFRYSITELALPKLKEKIRQEVGINKDFFDVFRIMNLKLAKLSMRDIVRLYDLDLSSRIYKPSIDTRGEKLSTQLPIFKLLIYMVELGMSCCDIDEDLSIKASNHSIDYLKLLFPLYFIRKDGGATCFSFGDGGNEILCDKDEEVTIRIRTRISMNDGISINQLPNLKSLLYCQSLAEYIDFSGLNRSSRYSILGYTPSLIS